MTDTQTETAPRARNVATHVDHDAGTVSVAHSGKHLAQVDLGHILPAGTVGTARNLVAFAVATLLARAASADDPKKGVAEMVERLTQPDWRPGRQKSETQPEPIIEALAQHLSKPVDFIIDTYLPRYCEAQGHMTTNGKILLARAKRELERHPMVVPILARVLRQRVKQDGGGKGPLDLGAIVPGDAAEAQSESRAEAAE